MSTAPPSADRSGSRPSGWTTPTPSGRSTGLLGQGCELVGLSSDDPAAAVARTARGRWPDAPWVDDPASLLRDPTIDLIVTAAVPDRRGPHRRRGAAPRQGRRGRQARLRHPRRAGRRSSRRSPRSGRFWSVTFSERFEVRCAVKAGELVRAGRIGRVVQTLGLGPHREGDRAHLAGGAGRPDWFYDRDRTGGILTDIASHQIDQFLWFTGSDDRRGRVQHGRQLHPSRTRRRCRTSAR